MTQKLYALGAVVLGLGLAWQSATANGPLRHHHAKPPACEPGYKIIEEVVMQDVIKSVCKMVPEFKKKWVYSMVDDPFCIRDSKHGECPNCSGPYCRKQLVKREILEPCPTMKCVTETVVERVAVTMYRKVPIGTPGSNIETIPVSPTPLKK